MLKSFGNNKYCNLGHVTEESTDDHKFFHV